MAVTEREAYCIEVANLDNRGNREANAFGFAKEAGAIGMSVIKEAKLPPAIWNVLDDNVEKSFLIMPPSVAGIGNGLIENNPVVATIQLAGLSVDIVSDSQTRKALLAAGKDIPGTAYHIYQTTWNDLNGSSGLDVQHMSMGKSGVGLIMGAGVLAEIINKLKTSGKSINKALKDMATILKDSGGEFILTGGKKYWRYADEIIFELKNGKILPNLKKHYHQGDGGELLGEVRDGYQLVKIGDDVKVRRVPDETPYTGSNYNGKIKHENGHTLERHGHDVTDDALIKRAKEGIAPDGSTINATPPYVKPPYSSKFDSPEALKHAYDKTNPESAAFGAITESPIGFKEVPYTRVDGLQYGKGVKKKYRYI